MTTKQKHSQQLNETDVLTLWQSTSMENPIHRDWCPGENQEISPDLVETGWGWVPASIAATRCL
jgi:hypothetical protein